MSELKISLAAARVNAKLRQEEVAEALHVSRASIVNWESGKSCPSAAIFRKLCSMYGLEENQIFLPSDST